MEAARVGKRGAIIVPAKLRKRYGIQEGTFVTAEEREGGILIRPAAIVPIERYTPERKAQFLLSTAINRADYKRAPAGQEAWPGPRRNPPSTAALDAPAVSRRQRPLLRRLPRSRWTPCSLENEACRLALLTIRSRGGPDQPRPRRPKAQARKAGPASSIARGCWLPSAARRNSARKGCAHFARRYRGSCHALDYRRSQALWFMVQSQNCRNPCTDPR